MACQPVLEGGGPLTIRAGSIAAQAADGDVVPPQPGEFAGTQVAQQSASHRDYAPRSRPRMQRFTLTSDPAPKCARSQMLSRGMDWLGTIRPVPKPVPGIARMS